MRPLRFLRLTPSLHGEGKCIFFESSTLKFFSNSSIIQKISVTLSLVIIAYIICNCLIFTYKDTKYLRDYQFLCVLFYPELTYYLIKLICSPQGTKGDISPLTCLRIHQSLSVQHASSFRLNYSAARLHRRCGGLWHRGGRPMSIRHCDRTNTSGR